MRFLLSSLVVAVGLSVTPQVLSDTLCVPNPDCSTYTADFAGSGANEAIDFKTPWSGQLGLDKFNPALGTLTSVKIFTKLYFSTEYWANRTTTATINGNSLASVRLNMVLAANSTVLGDYWGRWGNYAELDNNINDVGSFVYPTQGRNGQDVSGVGDQTNAAEDAAAPDLFVRYTYPLFDVVGATDGAGGSIASGNPLPVSGPVPSDPFNHAGPVWAYYIPSVDADTLNWPTYTYGTPGQANFVERIADSDQPDDGTGNPKSQYFVQTLDTALTNPDQHDLSGLAYGVPTYIGSSFFDMGYTTPGDAFAKSISSTDLPGGPSLDMTPQYMFTFFTGTDQVLFDVAANAKILELYTGGNADFNQTTIAKVASRIEYTYTANSGVAGDPQFGGFQGQSFQVHGYPGSYFNLFSAPSFQMNGRFAYLATGHCTYKHTPCWSHPGTYIDDIAFIVDELLVRVIAGPVATGYTVLLNDEPFHAHKHFNDSDALALTHDDDMVRQFVPTKFYDPNTRLTVHLKSPLELVVRSELVSFSIHNADHFFNVDSQLLVRPILSQGKKPSVRHPDPVTGKPGFPDYPIHGLIGQTWAAKQYPHKKQYQGEVDDYVETRPYATESHFSQYNKQFDDKQTLWE